jgi:hypothetical protein
MSFEVGITWNDGLGRTVESFFTLADSQNELVVLDDES